MEHSLFHRIKKFLPLHGKNHYLFYTIQNYAFAFKEQLSNILFRVLMDRIYLKHDQGNNKTNTLLHVLRYCKLDDLLLITYDHSQPIHDLNLTGYYYANNECL